MREVFIKYNPYKLETEIRIDGAAPKQNSKLNFDDRRLQEWIEELPSILFEECSCREFKIIFHGTILDYEDVESMAKDSEKDGFKFTIEHIPAKEVSDKEQAIAEIFDEIQAGPFDELKQPDVVKAFNLAKSSDFEVNVVATMSAGKSTLINALLREKLMPAKQEACTATITRIKDCDGKQFMAKVYNKDGALIQTHPELTYDIMNLLNSNPEVSRIEVEGNIPFVDSNDISLVLVDTPGPNNSRDPEHKAATYRMLSESSKTVVLYILNATQLAVNDDFNLLSHVAESMRVGGKQSRDRFIFVVNKLDDFKKGEDSIEDALNKVRAYLKDNGVENPNIYPASALTALNIRTILAQSDDEDDDEVYEAKGKVRKFNKKDNEEMHFEKYAPLTASARGQIENLISHARENGDVNGEALIHCGIVPIELAIKMYVQKYAKTAKIKNIVDTFSKRLESAKSFEITKQEIAENQDKHKEILANIDLIKRKLASGEEAKRFRDRVENVNYDKEIEELADKNHLKIQDKLTSYITQYKKGDLISQREAKAQCEVFNNFVKDLRAETQANLEEIITEHIAKNANAMLAEYRKRIAELAQDIDLGSIDIDPFKIMMGSIDALSNIDSIMKESETVKESYEKVGSHKEYNETFGFRRWMNDKFGTNFHVDYEVIDDYDWVKSTYIDVSILAQRFFAGPQEEFYEYKVEAIEYAKNQASLVKDEFKKKFDELNEVLKQKMEELESYANDSKDMEKRIEQSQAKLKWLVDIQNKTKSILDI